MSSHAAGLSFTLFYFTPQIRKKDQINIETKNKTVRFIGELAKFKMFSKTDTLHCLKVGEEEAVMSV